MDNTTAMQELIDYNDSVIKQKGNILSAFEIHNLVINKATELLPKKKEQIKDSYINGSEYALDATGFEAEKYYNNTFGK